MKGTKREPGTFMGRLFQVRLFQVRLFQARLGQTHPRPGLRLAMLAAPALLLLLWWLGVFTPWEWKLMDGLYQHPTGASSQIFVIGIDEYTLDAMGPFETWSRQGVAELVELLMAEEETAPAVIGLDIGFYGEKDPIVDARLAAACEKAGNVVTVSAATLGRVLTETSDGQWAYTTGPIVLEEPYPALRAHVAYGHANVDRDEDGVVRRGLLSIPWRGEPMEAFAAALYRVYTGEAANPPLSGDGQFIIPYSAKPYGYYGAPATGASLFRVLQGEYPVSAFAGAIVLVGAYAQGMMDDFDTPVSGKTRMYGVEIHANILQALLDGKSLMPLSGGMALCVCLLVWAACFALLWVCPAGYALPGASLLGVGYGALSVALSRAGTMLPLIPPLLGLLSMGVSRFLLAFLSMWRERRRLVADFSRYLPRAVARHVAEEGAQALGLSGRREEIAVLFADIRGFTPLSERLDPEALVAVLNRFLSLTTDSVFRHRGTVDKFVGDATMALFGAPEAAEDAPLQAVLAALHMMEAGRTLQASLGQELGVPLGFGVGIHAGEAVVGNIGTAHRMEYTAIGDTVNTAARLEGQAEAFEILISQAVYEAVKDHVACTFLGHRHLKGKGEPVPIWRADRLISEETEGGAAP